MGLIVVLRPTEGILEKGMRSISKKEQWTYNEIDMKEAEVILSKWERWKGKKWN